MNNKENIENFVLRIYRNGNLIKKYKLNNFINENKYRIKTVSHFLWCKNFGFIDNQKNFKLETFDKKIHIFNLYTGEKKKR